jgi:hypothetical protein
VAFSSARAVSSADRSALATIDGLRRAAPCRVVVGGRGAKQSTSMKQYSTQRVIKIGILRLALFNDVMDKVETNGSTIVAMIMICSVITSSLSNDETPQRVIIVHLIVALKVHNNKMRRVNLPVVVVWRFVTRQLRSHKS